MKLGDYEKAVEYNQNAISILNSILQQGAEENSCVLEDLEKTKNNLKECEKALESNAKIEKNGLFGEEKEGKF